MEGVYSVTKEMHQPKTFQKESRAYNLFLVALSYFGTLGFRCGWANGVLWSVGMATEYRLVGFKEQNGD